MAEEGTARGLQRLLNSWSTAFAMELSRISSARMIPIGTKFRMRKVKVLSIIARCTFSMLTKTLSGVAPHAAAVAPGRTSNRLRSFYVRYFFVGMALLFIAITALGFVPQLVAIHANHVHLHWFTHIHGVIMTMWLLNFLAQALLAARGRLNYHRQLGLFSVGFAPVVWITMGAVTASALIRDNPPEGDGQFNTLALILATMVLFGLFFTWGVLARKNAGNHKRLLLLAMLPLMSAGVDRIAWLPGLQSAYFVRFLYLDTLLIPLLIFDLVTLQRVHKWTMAGGACVILFQLIVVTAGASPAWHRFAYNALTPFVKRLPEIRLSEAQMELLVGEYGGKDWKMTVSREGGTVYLQLPTLPKWELGANSDTELFVRTVNWQLSFIKNPEGVVTKLVNRQPQTAPWEMPKTK